MVFFPHPRIMNWLTCSAFAIYQQLNCSQMLIWLLDLFRAFTMKFNFLIAQINEYILYNVSGKKIEILFAKKIKRVNVRKEEKTQEDTHSYRQTKMKWFNKSNIYILRIKVFGILNRIVSHSLQFFFRRSISTVEHSTLTSGANSWQSLMVSMKMRHKWKTKNRFKNFNCTMFHSRWKCYLQSYIHFQSCWLPLAVRKCFGIKQPPTVN